MSTINTILIKRRLESSGLNSIPTLSGGELAYSEKNHTLYYGGEFGALTIAGSGAFVDVLNTQTISGPKTFTNTTTISGLTVSGSSTLDFGSNVLTNLGTPVNDADATTKLYVDTVASGASSSTNALSSHVDTYFVEKVESDAVTLNGGLTVSSGLNADTIDTTGNATVGGNLTITGDLQVLGATTTIETTTTLTSAFSITNSGSETAFTATQTGNQNVAEFYDDSNIALAVVDGGNVGVGTLTPDEALTVVGNISASQTIYAPIGVFTEQLYSDGPASLGSTLDVTGAATINNTLLVTGLATLQTGLSTVPESINNIDGSVIFGFYDPTKEIRINNMLINQINPGSMFQFSNGTIHNMTANPNNVNFAGSLIADNVYSNNIVGFVIDGGSF